MSKDRKRGRWGRRLLVAGAASLAGVGALWVAIHEVPWLGPALADGVRSVVGPAPVAWAEDVAYGLADFVNTKTRASEAPKTFWEAPPTAPADALAPAPGAAAEDPMRGAPPPFAAPFPQVASEGDGTWIPVRAPGDVGPAAMWKSLVHPDAKRPFAAVAVVAIDRTRLELHLVAGTDEPKSLQVPKAERTGLVPEADQGEVVAAFNGGFKAMHGNYGMRIGERLFIPPRDIACTVGLATSGALTIRTYSAIEATEKELVWWRQTPPCLVEEGEPNPGLLHEFNRNWGATVGGDTIIRRSAIGLSEDGRHVFYALGDAVTAQSIGRAMLAVGSRHAAQLDVNYSYPRFLLFEKGPAGPSATEPLVPDVKYSPADYVRSPSPRDFFYVTRKRKAS